MRSLFSRHFITYTSIMMVSFLIVAVLFNFQINRYSAQEKQEQLQRTAEQVAGATTLLMDNYTVQVNEFYQFTIAQTAAENESAIILADADGQVLLTTDKDGSELPNLSVIPRSVIRQMDKNNYYSEIGGNFHSTFSTLQYIIGVPCYNSAEEKVAMIFVATEANAVFGLLREVTKTLFLVVAMVLILSLIVTVYFTNKITMPLKMIASASKSFGKGDFSVRVPENNNCDEIDELAVSFNNMAGSLEQLEELGRGFVANVSHELKTPMTSIGGFVDGMLDGTIPKEKWEQYLHIISEEIHRLSRLIMRMLNAAKIQSGELTLMPAPFDFCEMVSRIIISFEKQINDKQLDVEVDFQDEDIVVNGDKDNLFQSVYNLVDNAVKFTQQGGKLTIQVQKEGNQCFFSIKNTGVGIGEEDIPHIFDRFYKTDKSRGMDKTGAGLGLYIVKNIINLHGGDISVRSDGNETEFSFNIPLSSEKKTHKYML